MHDSRKQAVSLRLGAGDIRKIKRLARRLGVRDSDIIRYALKVTLSKLAPLCDPGVRGRSLMPVFVDTGVDILQHFDLDEESLDRIINEGVDDDAQRVEHSDLQLMALMGMQRGYAKLSLRELQKTLAATTPAPANGSEALDDSLSTSFRQHLYAKYVRAAAAGATPAHEPNEPHEPHEPHESHESHEPHPPHETAPNALTRFMREAA